MKSRSCLIASPCCLLPIACRRVSESVGQRFLNLRTMSGGWDACAPPDNPHFGLAEPLGWQAAGGTCWVGHCQWLQPS